VQLAQASVHQDEARHAAFGILTMRRVVKESTPEELIEMEDFAFDILETLNANQQLDMLHLLGPKYGIDPTSVVQLVTALPNFADLNSLPYMHTVVPNLRNLELTAPYFHNGFSATLAEVVEFYNGRFNIGLSAKEQSDLVAFLKAL
jgi:hypothetical protein